MQPGSLFHILLVEKPIVENIYVNNLVRLKLYYVYTRVNKHFLDTYTYIETQTHTYVLHY